MTRQRSRQNPRHQGTLSRRRLLGVSAAGAAIAPFGFGTGQANAADNSFHFGVIADCQYADFGPVGTRHYRASIEKLREAVQVFNETRQEFTLHLGDFVDRFSRSFAEILPTLNEAHRAKYHVLGNHDFQLPTPELLKVLEMPNQYYQFRRHGWRFVVLDTNDVSLYAHPEGSEAYEHARQMYEDLRQQGAVNAQTWNGAIGDEQLTWLRRVLAGARRRGENVVLNAHHPVYPKNAHNAWNDDAVVELLAEYDNVVAYFNGHNHHGNYAFRDGIHYVTFPGMVEQETNAYSSVRVHSDRFEIDGYGRAPDRALPFGSPAIEAS